MKQRGWLLACIAALFLVTACVVMGTFSYTPVIEEATSLEDIWALEDERTESESPLVTALFRDGVPLAYDEEENVFYCPVGMDRGETWPELRLTAAGNVHLRFTDDYKADACQDSVAYGTQYEVMAWTRTEYSYFHIVFTGLPVIAVHSSAPGSIGREDVACDVVWLGADEGMESYGRIHRRGASTLLTNNPKHGFRVEFTRLATGKKKIQQEVPEFGTVDSVVLLPILKDDTMVRDRLGWEIYNQMHPDGPFGARKLCYVELVLDGRYNGLYLAMEPFQSEKELEKMGDAHLLMDDVYRTAALNFSHGRKKLNHPLRGNAGYELYYAANPEQPFAGMDTYLSLIREKDDAAFCEKAMACIDLDSMLDHVLFVQLGGMTDNFFNNMYIWADGTKGTTLYRFVPWDLDETWGKGKSDIGEDYENWMYFPVADRMISLDAGGVTRARLLEKWDMFRETYFSEENIESLVDKCLTLVNDSGAMLRNSVRWERDVEVAEPDEILNFMEMRFAVMEEAEEIIRTAEGEIEFLNLSEYEKKGGPIFSGD